MATHFNYCTRATSRAALLLPLKHRIPLLFTLEPKLTGGRRGGRAIRVANDGGGSYLDMWKNAVDRERKVIEFQRIAENAVVGSGDVAEGEESAEVLERRSSEFQKILDVLPEERDRVQRMQVIDRAAAAIAAARAILKESSPAAEADSGESGGGSVDLAAVERGDLGVQQGGWKFCNSAYTLEVYLAIPNGSTAVSQLEIAGIGAPGPNFWSWVPPLDSGSSDDEVDIKSAANASPSPTQINPVMELERSVDFLSIPFESKHESDHSPPLPPLQSLMEIAEVEASNPRETPHMEEEHELGVNFSTNAAEAAHALEKGDEISSRGILPDGSRWWKETGTEIRADGVVCRWTLTRGVSADKAVEWEEKYWEASDEFDYKELGSEKSGRDATGNVWREFWKESMYQNNGCVHLEKTADKWGKNGLGGEWHEKWWENYGAGQAEKWAHKWCSIDPNTQLEAGHAHVWHERWGEKYDGQGGSTKYTDKWAERSEGDGWTKWGDKWDEHFNPEGQGVKQGETWWKGKYGERWNRTWGEGHNGSGWVHKYGKSSCGEHWDTHVKQDTWYERYPHYGFYHCFENSTQLRAVKKPSDLS
ncbi:hypothetical protein RJ639_009892 [Escallonia herrerae]|uniref:Uncharacterized protein n=1 Tax=Escallonia herrerae TaxID=1293975 RepID=A0AA88VRD5_9ASTE|nr:hypothetical protein RJ639_009892 [Escallonia herrerae]